MTKKRENKQLARHLLYAQCFVVSFLDLRSLIQHIIHLNNQKNPDCIQMILYVLYQTHTHFHQIHHIYCSYLHYGLTSIVLHQAKKLLQFRFHFDDTTYLSAVWLWNWCRCFTVNLPHEENKAVDCYGILSATNQIIRKLSFFSLAITAKIAADFQCVAVL